MIFLLVCNVTILYCTILYYIVLPNPTPRAMSSFMTENWMMMMAMMVMMIVRLLDELLGYRAVL